MEKIGNGIAGILWFIYRVIFTMIPTTLFFLICYFTINFVYSTKYLNGKSFTNQTFCKLHDIFNQTSFEFKVFAFILIIVCANVFLEALVMNIAYNVLGFHRLGYKLLKNHRDAIIDNNLKNLPSPYTVFHLMEAKSLIKHQKISEQIHYLLAREFLFNNSWMLLLIANVFIVPFWFSYPEEWRILLAIIFQLIVSSLIPAAIMLVIKKLRISDEVQYFSGAGKDNSNNKPESYKTTILLALLAAAIFLISGIIKYDLFQFAGIDLLALFFCYFLIDGAFIEYMRVEKLVHAYMLLTYKRGALLDTNT